MAYTSAQCVCVCVLAHVVYALVCVYVLCFSALLIKLGVNKLSVCDLLIY